MLTDMHLHLQDIPDLHMCKSVLSLAQELRVGQFVCNGTRPEDWPVVEKFAAEDRRVVPFFGVHPWYADKLPKDWYETLEGFLKRNPSAGVGEVGLDKARNVDLARQTEVFHRQLEIAGRFSRPLAIHCVRAWSNLLNVLRRSLPPKTRFMIHSYQGSREMLRDFLSLGAYISFSWKSLQRDTEESIALMRNVPLDRLLLETDFPYTEPGRIGADAHDEKYFETLQGAYDLAERAKGVDVEALEKAVWANGTAFLSGAPAR
ncbi:MAG: TatD family hydrolase [Candidatus Omnitrophica bacterium]|nr:TatD family hydrolase [Candidatus Omnitrophota bacterium]